jgi:uncharacterized membrane protein HdeD (DUF308 family)
MAHYAYKFIERLIKIQKSAQVNCMENRTMELFLDKRTRQQSIWFAVGLMIVGFLGMVLPQLLSITLSLLMAILLVAAGVLTGYLTWLNYARTGLAWLKPFLLIVLGLLIAFNPVAGAAALGLLLTIYFLLDGFASISFAFTLRPMRGWIWTLFNGIISLFLATIFLISWPFGSVWLVGMMVGISLMIDGAALLGLALSAETS